MSSDWLFQAVRPLDTDAQRRAGIRQSQLTKPPGSLGRMEEVVMRLAAMQGRDQPSLNNIRIVVFAADHGIANEDTSAFPQTVTTEMVRNFARGGAAINVLARQLNAGLEVVDLGTVVPPGELPGVVEQRISAGTANFAHQPAMTEEQCHTALDIGKQAIQRTVNAGTDLFIGGEMGIANTTSAAAIGCALLDRPAAELAGPGSGLDINGVRHKARLIDTAVTRYRENMDSPLAVLQTLGGYEIAALSGAYVAAAQSGLPILIDGFISSVALLMASRFNPGVLDWSIFAHRSAEPGHHRILDELKAEPLLDLGMRLGEGSGAAIAVGVLRDACALHNSMATFSEAGISIGE